MFPRSTLPAVVATVTLLTFSVSSSVAADAGHAATREAMVDLVRRARVPGVLVRAEDGAGAWHGSAGVADRRSGRPPLPGDRFRIGSITKTFVATVVLQLEAEGRLDLDDPVAAHIPAVVRGSGHDERRITVRRLLNHTSGVHDFISDSGFRRRYVGAGFLEHRFDSRTADELVRTAMRHPPDFEPGRGWGYSNTNYVLAGMLVEAVTGHRYAAEIERRVLRPLGLSGTSLPGTSVRIASPHGRAYSTLHLGRPGGPADGVAAVDASRVRDVTALDPSMAGASGEMVSTAGDLIDFYRALLGGRLLPERQLAEMTDTVATGGGPAGRADRYGLGIRATELSCGTTVWGHGGDIHGSVSGVATTRDGAHTAAFHVNADWASPSGGESGLLEAEFCG